MSVFELDREKLEELLGHSVPDRRRLTLLDLWKLYLAQPLLDLNVSIEHIMTSRKP